MIFIPSFLVVHASCLYPTTGPHLAAHPPVRAPTTPIQMIPIAAPVRVLVAAPEVAVMVAVVTTVIAATTGDTKSYRES